MPARKLSRNLLALQLFMAGFAILAMAQTQEKEERDPQRQRQEWFYRQRAYPHNYVPAGAHQRALKQLEQKLAAEKTTRARFALSAPPSWTFIGPQPIDTPYTDPVVSGRVTALAIDPGNVNTVYLGGAQGGVWKTTNGGTAWTPLTDTQASTAIGSIALDPSNSSTIYVGTGEENFSGDSYFGAGILKSTDGGTTWTQFCGPFCGPVGPDGFYGGGARIGGLAVHPTNGQILLAAVALLNNDGVYRSADGGNSWTKVLSGNPGNSVIFDPTNGNIAYASLGNSFSGGTEGVFKSTDGGQTWAAANGTGGHMLNLTNAGRIVLAVAPSSSTTLYAGITNIVAGDLLGLFKTTDGGINWTQLTSTPDYCAPQCGYDHVIAVQPTNPNVVFAGGAFTTTLVRSLNGGTTWSTLQSAQNFGFLHADMHALAFFPDGNTLYLGNDGGAYVTTQITATNPSFTALNSTLGLTQFYPGLSINPTNAAISIGGNQDNGTVIYSGALTWNDVVCGDGGYTAIDFNTPATMYATCQQFNIFKSTSNGAFGSWNVALNGINAGDRVDFIPPLVMDPSNSQTLYFGTDRVYQTTNGASNWIAISPDLTGGDSFFGVLSTIGVAPNNSNTVYVGTMDNRVQVTTNAGSGGSATWTNVSAGLPPRVVTHVAVDPTTSTAAYATFSGFTGFGDSLGHVFKTTNGGSTWTDISGDLPNTPVNFVVIDPDAPSTLFVATDVGVFYSTTGGTSWTSLVTGLPRTAVLGLTWHNASRTLRASTHGRGAWDINIASLPPVVSITSISPNNALVGSAAFTLTVNGVNFDSTSVAQWNGSNLATTFVNSSQVTAAVPAADVAMAGTFSVTVFNSSTGQTSNPATFTVNNPLPALTSLSPNSATVGGAGFTLTVNGSNFVNGASVLWNGSARSTTFVNSGQVTAAILASDIAAAGTASITVSNPAPGGGPSNALTFTIDNPVPVLTSLSPSSKTVGSAGFTLTVNGSKFVHGATISWNNSARSTTFVSSVRVTARILTSDLATAGTVPVIVTNPGPGGGASNSLTFTINNPRPTVTSISPTSATAGGAAFTLTVNGSGFITTSVVKWNGAARTTTFSSSTRLTAAISAADIATAGTIRVTVTNPGPGGGTSASKTFTINNPVPAISSTSPSSATAGGPGFTLTVNGSNFVSSSKVHWKTSTLTTHFVSSTQVTATVPASDIATAGTASVTVVNAPPGGGTSNAVTFTITP
jgi:hypothetical protein